MANGQAVARADGLVVFCFGPLPGERAVVRVVTPKATYAVAELVRLLETSPERAEPFCPVFGICGGCQVQHLAYDAQLRYKRDLVRSALQRIGGFQDPPVEPTIDAGSPRAYRNKMALVVEPRAGGPIVGFYRARSHDVVPIDGCPIVDEQLSDDIARFAHAGPGDALRAALDVSRHVVARTSNGSAVVSFTTQRREPVLARLAPDVMASLPGTAGIANSYEPASANAVMGRNEAVLTGTGEVEASIDGIAYRVSPGSFFQVNVPVVECIFHALADAAQAVRCVVDLYCGMGTFALYFARAGATVIGVEENRRAVEEARANAERNGLAASFACRRVEEWVRTPDGARALAGAGIVFLDPPRKGSDPVTLEAIAAARVSRVLYLSCDPATLARDLRLLAANGYGLRSVQPFDMFPQTGHVEALACLTR